MHLRLGLVIQSAKTTSSVRINRNEVGDLGLLKTLIYLNYILFISFYVNKAFTESNTSEKILN